MTNRAAVNVACEATSILRNLAATLRDMRAIEDSKSPADVAKWCRLDDRKDALIHLAASASASSHLGVAFLAIVANYNASTWGDLDSPDNLNAEHHETETRRSYRRETVTATLVNRLCMGLTDPDLLAVRENFCAGDALLGSPQGLAA